MLSYPRAPCWRAEEEAQAEQWWGMQASSRAAICGILGHRADAVGAPAAVESKHVAGREATTYRQGGFP